MEGNETLWRSYFCGTIRRQVFCMFIKFADISKLYACDGSCWISIYRADVIKQTCTIFGGIMWCIHFWPIRLQNIYLKMRLHISLFVDRADKIYEKKIHKKYDLTRFLLYKSTIYIIIAEINFKFHLTIFSFVFESFSKIQIF